MQDCYSPFNPELRLLSDIFRSILVSVEVKIASYTSADFKQSHLHAIVSGFTVGGTLGVGTFYDFHKRLWLSDYNKLSISICPSKEKPSKPKGRAVKTPPISKNNCRRTFSTV